MGGDGNKNSLIAPQLAAAPLNSAPIGSKSERPGRHHSESHWRETMFGRVNAKFEKTIKDHIKDNNSRRPMVEKKEKPKALGSMGEIWVHHLSPACRYMYRVPGSQP